MGDRGPNSQNKNMHVLPAPKNKRKSPMPGMTKPARVIWSRVVKAYPVDHFKPQHYDILKAYCEDAALRDKAERMLEEVGHVSMNPKTGIEKESPWMGIKNKAENLMSQLGTKLGITYNATTVSRGDTGQNSKPKSKREGLVYRK